MLKQLVEKRNALLDERDQIVGKAEAETRAFEVTELTRMDEIKTEVSRIDASITAIEETRDSKTEKQTIRDEKRTLAEEIRAIQDDANKEIDLSEREIRADGSHVLSSTSVGTGNAATEVIAKTTFASYILDKLAYVSPLYGAIRHERFGASKHQIPVQANKLGKFVPMKELAEYSKQVGTYEPIKLEAHKFGTLIAFSEESLEDTGYNIEGDLLQQLTESYGMTVDEMVVKGEVTSGCEGLNSFTITDGAKEVAITGEITPEKLTEIYFKLPVRYRNLATWVISDDMARQLTDAKFPDGRPVFVNTYNGSPVGASTTILGRPVIINEHVDVESGKVVFFGDLSRALIAGERKSLTIQKSTEYGWVRDEIAIKANMRMDIKKGIGESIVIGTKAAAKVATR